jgi:hypothetical protein
LEDRGVNEDIIKMGLKGIDFGLDERELYLLLLPVI